MLEIIELKVFAGKSKKKSLRLRGRVIGSEGMCRTNLEKMTHCHICIHGNTVCVIGKIEDALLAKGAVEYLLEGAPHGHVYKYVEKSRKR